MAYRLNYERETHGNLIVSRPTFINLRSGPKLIKPPKKRLTKALHAIFGEVGESSQSTSVQIESLKVIESLVNLLLPEP